MWGSLFGIVLFVAFGLALAAVVVESYEENARS
jgi:hypothetical protein